MDQTKRNPKPRGSIIYEILIVLLTLGLIGSIVYPKKVWEKEERERDICRQRMLDIQNAELLYFSKNNSYSENLREVIEFLKSDTSLAATIDTLILSPLDSLYTCPTTGDTYKITVIDTSAIEVLKIECPIDEEDIQRAKKNILFSVFGGGSLENHGCIDGGKISWEEEGKK